VHPFRVDKPPPHLRLKRSLPSDSAAQNKLAVIHD
jgi:hypothetical protein